MFFSKLWDMQIIVPVLLAIASIWLWHLGREVKGIFFIQASISNRATKLSQGVRPNMFATLFQWIRYSLYRIFKFPWDIIASLYKILTTIGFLFGGILLFIIFSGWLEPDTKQRKFFTGFLCLLGVTILLLKLLLRYPDWHNFAHIVITLILIWITLAVTSVVDPPIGGTGGYSSRPAPPFPISEPVGTESIGPTSLMGAEFHGEAELPQKVYEGDSQTIAIRLSPTLKTRAEGIESLNITDIEDRKSLRLSIREYIRPDHLLEIELQGAGLLIDGEKIQRQALNSSTLNYYWNCYFSNSGNHEISLILRLFHPERKLELGVIRHKVRVVKLDGMTKRQIWIIATIGGTVSGFLAIIKMLQELGVL